MTSCLAKSSSTLPRAGSKIAVSRPISENLSRMFVATTFARSMFGSICIPGAGQTSTSRSTVLTLLLSSSSSTPSWSFLETSTTTLIPRAPRRPRAMPKLPEVASKTTIPLLSFPDFMASCIICAAALLLTEPPNRGASSFPKT